MKTSTCLHQKKKKATYNKNERAAERLQHTNTTKKKKEGREREEQVKQKNSYLKRWKSCAASVAHTKTENSSC